MNCGARARRPGIPGNRRGCARRRKERKVDEYGYCLRDHMLSMDHFWQDRRVFVTGCTGLVGSWIVRALRERGAHVVGLIRDQVTGSELARSGLIQQIDLVHGSVEDQPLLERALGEYEIQTVIHLAAQT